MTTRDYLQMLRDIKDVAFATVDEQGNPQVRIIDIMLIADDAVIFCTARGKDFYQQLMHNHHVALTGMNKNWQMLRLTGIAQRLEDQKLWLDRIFAANPSMNDIYPGDSRSILEAFSISEGSLEFFDLGHQPIVRNTATLGSIALTPKGFDIDSTCIGCGKCAAICPQQCITPGHPYTIQQSHCLHCGQCAERCPAHAIHKQEATPC